MFVPFAFGVQPFANAFEGLISSAAAQSFATGVGNLGQTLRRSRITPREEVDESVLVCGRM